MAQILIIDDEPDIRATVEILLGRMGHRTAAADSVREALECLRGGQRFDLVLTDMRLGDGTGLDIVRWMNAQQPEVPITVITAYGSSQDAVNALKCGAFDYVEKPVDTALLRRIVLDALNSNEAALNTSGTAPAEDTSGLVGDAPAMRSLRTLIDKLARTQAPVFIHGESGTGKELVAREIHRRGPRASGPFIPVNCGAIPADLFESELFGHLKGSFSGAHTDRDGLFTAAAGGTLFLDEVVDLPLPMQVKLLRALQERAIRPVGSQREVAVDVRIISAAQAPLAEAVAARRLREDLYFRLNVISLPVPALRERREDLPALSQHLLARIAQRLGTPPPELSATALQALQAHPFPGNVRELENLLERACALAEPGQPLAVQDMHLDAATTASPVATQEGAQPNEANQADAARTASIDTELAQTERQRILAALETTRWNRTRAAEKLGISFRSLRYRLKKLGLERD